MSSNRRRKQKAQSLGLNDAELQLTELLGQVLELLRWNQVLGYSNQYLLHERLGLSPQERRDVMKAAAGAVEQDGRMQDWGKRLLEIQDSLQSIHTRMTGEGAAVDNSADDNPADDNSADDNPADDTSTDDGSAEAAGA